METALLTEKDILHQKGQCHVFSGYCYIFVVAEREDGRLRAEIQRLQKELDQLRERRNVYEVNTILF